MRVCIAVNFNNKFFVQRKPFECVIEEKYLNVSLNYPNLKNSVNTLKMSTLCIIV